jgi:hypothetical protein
VPQIIVPPVRESDVHCGNSRTSKSRRLAGIKSRTGHGHGPDCRYQFPIVEDSERQIDCGRRVEMLRQMSS